MIKKRDNEIETIFIFWGDQTFNIGRNQISFNSIWIVVQVIQEFWNFNNLWVWEFEEFESLVIKDNLGACEFEEFKNLGI